MFELKASDHQGIVDSIKRGKSVRESNRACAINMREKGFSVIEIAESLEMTPRTVINICNTYMESGLTRALEDDPRTGRPPKFDARIHYKIIATVCSDPPEGFDRWTLDLSKERLESKGDVKSIGRETISVILREHDLKPWQEKMWCIPELTEEYITRMEDVLDVYESAYNAAFPVVCLDEKPVVLHEEVRAPIPMTDGQAKRSDCEYKRNGTANIFCTVEPKIGKYSNSVTPTRSGYEFARFLQELSGQYPDAVKIVLVMDNLSTHKERVILEHLGEDIGAKLWARFQVHYTPKHASWLNQAEIAIGMLQRQCIGTCRIPNIALLTKKTKAWNRAVNRKKVIIKWNFFKEDAREKFDYQ